MATRRLMIEYGNIKKELHNNSEYENILSLEPLDDLYNWECTIKGPEGSPFENGIWHLKIVVPQNYPTVPPKISFKNKICHPNVNFDTGEICLDILRNNWTPAWSLLSSLVAILLLLLDPEPNSPLNIDVSNILKEGDHSAYKGLIGYYTHKYASR